MNIKSWLFGNNIKKTPLSEDEDEYKVGWTVYTKNGDTLNRTYTVSESQRQSVRKTIENEIEVMENALHLAMLNKKTFVNLNGNLFRVDDIVKICIFDSIK